jgi:hypothetical protein
VSAQTYDTRLGRKFAELVGARITVITDNVMNGAYSEKEYAKEVGRFHGLREALELYEEAEALAKGAERS